MMGYPAQQGYGYPAAAAGYAAQPGYPQAAAGYAAYPAGYAQAAAAQQQAYAQPQAAQAAAYAQAQAAQAYAQQTAAAAPQQNGYAQPYAQPQAAAVPAPPPAPAAPGAAPAAPAAAGETCNLDVIGCQNGTVGPIVRGNFVFLSESHGKPVFKKDQQVNGMDVMIYFWDERDGPSFCGWWFGPKVGGDQVWAYHPERAGRMPPTSGWKVPYDGPIDPTFAVNPVAGGVKRDSTAGYDQAAKQQRTGYEQPNQQQLQQMTAQQQQQIYQQQVQQQQQAQYAQQVQQQQLQQQHLAQQQQMLQQQQVQRQEQERQRQQAMQQENLRRMQELKIKQQHDRQREQERRQVEEVQRKEEARAMLAIRRVLQTLQTATDANFDQTVKELEEVKTKELEACGSQKTRIDDECTRSVEMSKMRLEALKDAEKQRIEDSATAKLRVQELGSLVDVCEAKAEALKGLATPLTTQELSLKEVEATMQSVEDAGAETRAASKACTDFIMAKGEDMKKGDTPPTPEKPMSELKQELAKLLQRINDAVRGSEHVLNGTKGAKDRALRRDAAKDKQKAVQGLFSRYDKDKDGCLSKKEVLAYSMGEFSFKLPEDRLDLLFKLFVDEGAKGVKFEQFQRIKSAVGCARELEKDRKKVEERKEKERVAKEKREALETRISDCKTGLDVCQEQLVKLELEANTLVAKAKDMASPEMLETSDAVDGQTKDAKGASADARKAIEKLSENLEEMEEPLQQLVKLRAAELTIRSGNIDNRLLRVVTLMGKFREQAVAKRVVEIASTRAEALPVMRFHQCKHRWTIEQLFDAITKNKDGISEADFLAFFKTCDRKPKAEKKDGEDVDMTDVRLADLQPDDMLTEENLRRLFKYIVDEEEGENGCIPRTVFLQIARMWMRVAKETVLTNDMSIKDASSQTYVRRLEVDEVVEVLEGPKKEEDSAVERVYVSAKKDGAVGWVTVAGNQGTTYLEEGGNLFRVIAETIFTSTFELDSTESTETRKVKDVTRKLKVGELLEVRVWPQKEEKTGLTRMKGKIQSDGKVGWATTVGNAGNVFLEAYVR